MLPVPFFFLLFRRKETAACCSERQRHESGERENNTEKLWAGKPNTALSAVTVFLENCILQERNCKKDVFLFLKREILVKKIFVLQQGVQWLNSFW